MRSAASFLHSNLRPPNMPDLYQCTSAFFAFCTSCTSVPACFLQFYPSAMPSVMRSEGGSSQNRKILAADHADRGGSNILFLSSPCPRNARIGAKRISRRARKGRKEEFDCEICESTRNIKSSSGPRVMSRESKIATSESIARGNPKSSASCDRLK